MGWGGGDWDAEVGWRSKGWQSNGVGGAPDTEDNWEDIDENWENIDDNWEG